MVPTRPCRRVQLDCFQYGFLQICEVAAAGETAGQFVHLGPEIRAFLVNCHVISRPQGRHVFECIVQDHLIHDRPDLPL